MPSDSYFHCTPCQRWAPMTTLRVLNIFLETLYEEWSYIVYKHGIVQYILSVQVLIWYKNRILHRQTIYKITGKVMPFYNNCFKIQIKTFRIKYFLFSHFMHDSTFQTSFQLGTGFPKIFGIHRKPSVYCHQQSQNNWKPCFDLVMYEGLAEVLNSIYFLSPPPFFDWGEVRTNPTPCMADVKQGAALPLHLLLCDKSSDGQIWLKIPGSNERFQFPLAATWVCGYCGFTSSSSSATSHLFDIPWERVSWVFLVGCLFLSRSRGCLELFSDSHLSAFWPQVTLSSLPSDYHENWSEWTQAW